MSNFYNNWRVFRENLNEEEAPLDEVTFSAFNFPHKGNENFAGSGSRTEHASTNNSFKVLKDVNILHRDGSTNSIIQSGTEVYFLEPFKLFKGADLGVVGRGSKGTFALVSLEQKDGTPIGFINIRAVEKPSGTAQSRVGSGSSAQEKVFEIIRELGNQKNVKVEKISSAIPGSTHPDLIVNYDNENIQFEIKGRKGEAGYITIFDKSLRRGIEVPILNAVIEAYVATLDVTYNYDLDSKKPLASPQSAPLRNAMAHTGYQTTFEGLLSFYQNYVDPSYGFCSDRGPVPKSGKLPRDLTTSANNIVDSIYTNIIEHLVGGGDDYFVVYTESSKTADIYSIGKNNPLAARKFPSIVSAKLATYGGCSSGATRVGFKIKIEPIESNLPDNI